MKNINDKISAHKAIRFVTYYSLSITWDLRNFAVQCAGTGVLNKFASAYSLTKLDL